MPLKLNVGLSRKVGEANYGSRGASVDIELELDSNLAADPAKLQERIRQLFDMVRSSLTEELNGNGGNHANSSGRTGEGSGPASPNGNGNGANQNGRQSQQPRGATQSQVKAIFAIAKNQHIDLKRLLSDRFQRSRPDDLSIQEASKLIDELKNSASREGG